MSESNVLAIERSIPLMTPPFRRNSIDKSYSPGHSRTPSWDPSPSTSRVQTPEGSRVYLNDQVDLRYPSFTRPKSIALDFGPKSVAHESTETQPFLQPPPSYQPIQLNPYPSIKPMRAEAQPQPQPTSQRRRRSTSSSSGDCRGCCDTVSDCDGIWCPYYYDYGAFWNLLWSCNYGGGDCCGAGCCCDDSSCVKCLSCDCACCDGDCCGGCTGDCCGACSGDCCSGDCCSGG
ncbi:hypothetical protein CPB83DRAFT_885310, partial [Crepidotus variabilis]